MNNFKSTREVVLSTVRYVSGETVDYGAGTAKYQHLIRPHASHYKTFDMVPGKNIDIVGDALKPPFADNSLDTVISTQVLEHVEKPWLMVAEIGRILKPGGICIVTAPFLVPYHADPHDFFRYTTEGLASLFKNEGFEMVEMGSYGRAFTVFSEMLHFLFFNPYKPNGRNKWPTRFVRYMEKFIIPMDKFVKNEIIYPNVYAVMRKKRA